MGTGIYFPMAALPFSILLIILFFAKKHLNTNETKIYRNLIIINLLCIISELLCTYASIIYNQYTLISNIIYKSYLIGLLLYVYEFVIYVTTIQDKNIKKISKIFLLVSIFMTCFLPIKLVVENNFTVRYTTGPSVMATYIAVGISMIYIIIISLKNIKKILIKKYIPIFVLIFLGMIVITIQFVFPQLLLITYLTTLVCVIMYFTIENPDLQMLREFHKQREFANESNQEKSSFLFNMSNQIKQPIEIINKISSEALIENDIEQIKEEVRQIKYYNNDLHQIVNNVLDISDIEQRKIEIRGNRYNVYNLFSVINKTFEKDLNKNIEYRFNYDRSIPEYLYGDSIRLKQIMNILLDNAKDYTKKGFIEVNVNSIIKNDICRLIITVEDSGSGITSEELEHLFDKEKIYSDETLKLIDDTKNNLGIAKSLIDLMNGSITVKSELGSGSKFTIVIDQIIKEEEKTKIEETVDQYEKMLEKKKKILLVISSSDLSKKINLYLKKQPYDIVEVIGGQPCLERLRNKEKYNIILMEENLEKLSSEDTLIKIKDTPGYKIPVVLISNNKGFGAKEMYQEKGFKDVIFMPIKKNELLEIIKENIN